MAGQQRVAPATLSADVEDAVDQGESERPTGVMALVIGASRYVALLTAWVAMCGSLFFSEVFHWPPCVMCWYQRILMYPLGLLLTVGILRRDKNVHTYVLPLSLIGAGFSTYHYLLIKTNWLPIPACAAGGVPCTTDYLNLFGFINIPFLALTAFIIITFMMLFSTVGQETDDEADDQPAGRGAWLAVGLIIVGVVGTALVLAQMYTASVSA